MLEGMACKGCMVHFYIQLEVLIKSVMAQETNHRFRVKVILVLAGFHRFGLYEESPVKSLFPSIVTGHGKKCCEMVLFAFHVGVEK